MSVWINDFIKINRYSRPGKKLKGKVKGILHYTANHGATAKNHVTYFGKSLIEQNENKPEKKRRFASAHIFVDRNEARCIIPLDEVAYAANDGNYRGVSELKPNANYLSISVEMCQESDGSFHPATISRTEDVFVELCKMFNWNPLKDIVRHYDVTHKNCPAPWVSNPQSFIDFKTQIKQKLNPVEEVEIMSIEDVKPTATPNKGIGVVRVLENTVLRESPVYTSPIIRTLKKDEEYVVYGLENGWYNGGNSWIHSGSVFFLPTRDLKISN